MKYLFIILFFFSCTTVKPVTATLDGSKSYDEDGYIVQWQWRQITTSADIDIYNQRSSVTSVTIKKKGIYQFELTVTDNQGAEGKDTINIRF